MMSRQTLIGGKNLVIVHCENKTLIVKGFVHRKMFMRLGINSEYI